MHIVPHVSKLLELPNFVTDLMENIVKVNKEVFLQFLCSDIVSKEVFFPAKYKTRLKKASEVQEHEKAPSKKFTVSALSLLQHQVLF